MRLFIMGDELEMTWGMKDGENSSIIVGLWLLQVFAGVAF